MNPRTPPRLAQWLLDRLGPARQNAPLVGDLLEEFRDGRSPAWFWRQTLAVILSGFAGNARRYRRLLAARLFGWAAAGIVAFGLRQFHLSARLNGWIGLSAGVALLSLWCVLSVRRRWREKSGAPKLSDDESLEEWNELEEIVRRRTQRILAQAYASAWFIVCLMAYGVGAFLVAFSGPISLWAFVVFQLQLLVASVMDVLAPSKEPGLAILLLTR